MWPLYILEYWCKGLFYDPPIVFVAFRQMRTNASQMTNNLLTYISTRTSFGIAFKENLHYVNIQHVYISFAQEPQQNAHSAHVRPWNHSAGQPCQFLYLPFRESPQRHTASTGTPLGRPSSITQWSGLSSAGPGGKWADGSERGGLLREHRTRKVTQHQLYIPTQSGSISKNVFLHFIA